MRHITVCNTGDTKRYKVKETTRYPHAGYLVVKAMVTRETTPSPQFFWHFPEANTKNIMFLINNRMPLHPSTKRWT